MTGHGNREPRKPSRVWRVLAQVALGTAVVVFIGRSLVRNWAEFTAIQFAFIFRPGWIALAALTVWVTYGIQVESWRRVLAGWNQQISYRSAAKAWCLANLGRYIPGKVWSVAGLVVLAHRAGIQGWAAGASTVAIQALGLGTGVALVAATLPPQTPALGLALGALVAIATLGLLTWGPAARWLGGLTAVTSQLRALPVRAVAAGGSLTLFSWVTYGLAFWCLARGLGTDGQLTPPAAAGVFALGYLIGLMAIIVPGGVGVRELAFVGILTPTLGAGAAIALSVASRLLLTLTEATAALAAATFAPAEKEDPVDPTRS